MRKEKAKRGENERKEKIENEKEKRIEVNKREGVQWIRGRKKKPKRKRGGKSDRGEKEKTWEKKKKGGEKKKGRFSRRCDGRISTVRELKSIHATMVTHGYQNLGVSSNSKR